MVDIYILIEDFRLVVDNLGGVVNDCVFFDEVVGDFGFLWGYDVFKGKIGGWVYMEGFLDVGVEVGEFLCFGEGD